MLQWLLCVYTCQHVHIANMPPTYPRSPLRLEHPVLPSHIAHYIGICFFTGMSACHSQSALTCGKTSMLQAGPVGYPAFFLISCETVSQRGCTLPPSEILELARRTGKSISATVQGGHKRRLQCRANEEIPHEEVVSASRSRLVSIE